MGFQLASKAIVVVLGAAASAAASEFLVWLLVYRREGYQRLRKSIDRTTKQMEVAKATPEKSEKDAAKAAKQKAKRVSRFEDDLRYLERDIAAYQSRAMAFVSLLLVAFYWALSSIFDGVPVAKLPFVPFNFLTGITHRGMEGTDMTECSVAFLYSLTAMALRANVQKVTGFAPPKGVMQQQAAKDLTARLTGQKVE